MTLHPWLAIDKEELVPAILEMMKEQVAHGADISPTEANAVRMWEIGFAWGNQGFPTLQARYYGELAGWVVRGPAAFTFDSHAPPALSGLGQWVRPDLRGRGIGSMMQDAAFGWAERNGFSRMVGVIFPNNERRLSWALDKEGARIAALVVEWPTATEARKVLPTLLQQP